MSFLPVVVRAARIVATAMAIGIGAAMAWANATSWGLEDWQTYLIAADRVASGGPVYDWSAGHECVYRYAPWFAYAVVPFLALPRWAADLVWSSIVLVGTLGAVLPLIRHQTWAATALAFLGAGLLLRVASTGNVHPLLIAGLVLGLHTRAGPVVVALAASLKATPILFAAVFVAQRRWLALAATLALTVALVLPMAWLGYEVTPGPSESLFDISPILWLVFAALGVAVLVAQAVRGSSLSTLASGTAAYLALPRSFLYDVTMLLPASSPRAQPAPSADEP